jgi:sugar phosphate isomerase/epimerase
MKYAFMSFSTPDLNLAGMLDLAKKLGYDGIEPRTVSGHQHGIELETSSAQRRAIQAQVADSGIALVCLATSLRYADATKLDEQIEETYRYLDLAAEVGAPRLRVFGGKIPAGVSRAAVVETVVQGLQAVAGHAADRKVTICLETHDDWCNPVDVVAVLRAVNSPYVAVNWDVMHPVRAAGMSMGQAFTLLQPWIRHVHIHDGTGPGEPLTMLPIGQGVYDHKRVVALLKRHNYDGYLSGEWISWEPYELHLPRELAVMQQYEAELA